MEKGDIDRAFSRAEDSNTEEWRQYEYDENAADSCIPIGDSGFSFIKKLFLADPFSVTELLVFNPTTGASAGSEEMFFGDYIESQYYNYLGGKKSNNSCKGGRLAIGDICEILYSFQHVLSYSEIKRSCNIGGNNPLLVCRDFFDGNIKIPTLDGSSNAREKQGQRGAAETGKLQISVQISNNKKRVSKY